MARQSSRRRRRRLPRRRPCASRPSCEGKPRGVGWRGYGPMLVHCPSAMLFASRHQTAARHGTPSPPSKLRCAPVIDPPICLPIYLSVHLTSYLSVYMYVRPSDISTYLSSYLPICPPTTYLSLYIYVCPSDRSTYLSTYLPICPPTHLSVSLYVYSREAAHYPSICLPIYLFHLPTYLSLSISISEKLLSDSFLFLFPLSRRSVPLYLSVHLPYICLSLYIYIR